MENVFYFDGKKNDGKRRQTHYARPRLCKTFLFKSILPFAGFMRSNNGQPPRNVLDHQQFVCGKLAVNRSFPENCAAEVIYCSGAGALKSVGVDLC